MAGTKPRINPPHQMGYKSLLSEVDTSIFCICIFCKDARESLTCRINCGMIEHTQLQSSNPTSFCLPSYFMVTNCRRRTIKKSTWNKVYSTFINSKINNCVMSLFPCAYLQRSKIEMPTWRRHCKLTDAIRGKWFIILALLNCIQ